jgi:hypothetical protein
MLTSRFITRAGGALLTLALVGETESAALADTASTAAIIAGAAAITGAILYDGSNRPYYVRNNHRYYVTQSEEHYYRSHHAGVERRAYVPEREYPVARDPEHGNGGPHGDRQRKH